MFEPDGSLHALLNRRKPSFWSLFLVAPFTTLAKRLHQLRQSALKGIIRPVVSEDKQTISVVCVSDTHNSQPQVPPGDLFIHAGDLSQGGTRAEIQKTLDWIDTLPHQYKIVIAGNHDMFLDRTLCKMNNQELSLEWGSIIYLEDTSTVLRFDGGRAITIYGTPHTRKHGSWGFQYPHGTDVFTDTVPDETDILISHSPPRFHLDVDGWGDDNLLQELWRVRPTLHVFGHIHEGYGREFLAYDLFQRQYEDICRTNNSLINFWRVLRLAFYHLTAGLSIKSSSSRFTTAVNPSAVGGLRDTEKREPIVVEI